MIIQVKGNVTYPITLDPSVWIFDDRKIRLEDAFHHQPVAEEDDQALTSRLNKPPVNHSIKKYNKKELLHYSYVMPLKPFMETAEIDDTATEAIIETEDGKHPVSLETLLNSLMLFSIDGRQIKEDGPGHLYFGDGSNRQNPIKAIKIIQIQ
ncbi:MULTISPECIES: hypothetical protein [Gracilibacillus]|uniref:hypothetical protein n=1 Tax=Gracilibacillus TaxID=74385 RepID=UPI0008270CBA|nr:MULTISPECIES: hypothetical protein [Gracilibacillus]